MAKFHGIQIYEILENGNLLNAIYTNTGNNYDIDNEIATKTKSLNNGIVGTYDVRYIESGNPSVTDCILEISKKGQAYEFVWEKNGTPIWKGIGLMAGSNYVAVSYSHP